MCRLGALSQATQVKRLGQLAESSGHAAPALRTSTWPCRGDVRSLTGEGKSKGVIPQAVKEVVESLTADGEVQTDKVGSQAPLARSQAVSPSESFCYTLSSLPMPAGPK